MLLLLISVRQQQEQQQQDQGEQTGENKNDNANNEHWITNVFQRPEHEEQEQQITKRNITPCGATIQNNYKHNLHHN